MSISGQEEDNMRRRTFGWAAGWGEVLWIWDCEQI